MLARLALTLSVAGLAAAGVAGSALAADPPLGQHVSMCAQMSLGERADAPTVTCTHDGVTMTFANFGAMVAHMRNG